MKTSRVTEAFLRMFRKAPAMPDFDKQWKSTIKPTEGFGEILKRSHEATQPTAPSRLKRISHKNTAMRKIKRRIYG
jgi:hypothetical protein